MIAWSCDRFHEIDWDLTNLSKNFLQFIDSIFWIIIKLKELDKIWQNLEKSLYVFLNVQKPLTFDNRKLLIESKKWNPLLTLSLATWT